MTPAGARSDPVLRTRSLTKRYRSGTAVENLDLHLERGRVYGLIGRNGAGKTTLMRMACGLVTPTDGEIELFGHPARPGSGPAQDDLRRLGCLIEAPGLQMRMSARANLHLHRIIRGIPSPTLEDELLGLVGLADAGDKRVGEFSLGMRQRLGIAIALVAGPELLPRDPGPGFGGPGRRQTGDDVVLRREGDWRVAHCSSSPLFTSPGTCSCLRVSR